MVENDYYKDIISALQKIEDSSDRDTIRKVTKIWRHEYQKHIGIGRRVFIIGNGGSCAIAEHISTDLNKRCKVKALTLSNNSLLTALTNDYTQEHALVEWMKMNNFGKTDFLVGISSSGLSKNILFALEHASDCLAWYSRRFCDRMSERILKQVLHNEDGGEILITVSDKVKTETLKKIYTILLDEEIKHLNPQDKEATSVGRK